MNWTAARIRALGLGSASMQGNSSVVGPGYGVLAADFPVVQASNSWLVHWATLTLNSPNSYDNMDFMGILVCPPSISRISAPTLLANVDPGNTPQVDALFRSGLRVDSSDNILGGEPSQNYLGAQEISPISGSTPYTTWRSARDILVPAGWFLRALAISSSNGFGGLAAAVFLKLDIMYAVEPFCEE